MILIVLALVVAVLKLWLDQSALRDRVRALEFGAPALPRADVAPGWAERPPAASPRATARVVYPHAARPTDPDPAPAPGSVTAADLPVHHSRTLASLSLDDSQDERAETDPPLRGDDDVDPAVPPQPAAQPTASAPASTPRPGFSFEDLFGRKLPIWAGGITLAVCGFLIVKYSIDAGLLSPWVRVVGGLLFGGGLIAGAEAALRNEDRVRDPRVRQALSGAGVATLYAAILVAANLYHLVPPLAAFAGLAGVTLLAGALSIRFGPPSAVLGLVGGLAAPALVGSGDPDVPLLAAYLALAVGGLATLGRAQRWWWLGVAALIGGFGWGLVLIASGALDLADSLAVGGFLLLLGVGLPVALFGGERGALVRLGGTLAAAAQLAALVATGGFALLHWGLFGLLGLAAVWLSRRERVLADLPALALAIALLLLAAWPAPAARDLTIVLVGAAVIVGVPAMRRLWRPAARLSDAGSIAALAAAPITLALIHLDPSDRAATLLALLGSTVAAVAAALGWRQEGRRGDVRFALLASVAALLFAAAAPFALPEPWTAPAWAAVGAGVLLLARAADDRRLDATAWLLTAIAIVALPLVPWQSGIALDRAYGQPRLTPIADVIQALRWGLAAAGAGLFAARGAGPLARGAGAALAVLLGYVAAAQLVPPPLLPLVPAAAVATLGLWRRVPVATATAGLLAALWAAWPLAVWLAAGGGALFGTWVRVDALPSVAEAATRLLAPGLALALLYRRSRPAPGPWRDAVLAGLALIGTAAAHIAYKQLFAIRGVDQFIAHGLAERTLWEALLAAAALLLVRRLPGVARALGLAAFAHLAWFTLLLHNPLWLAQAVGALPILNLLLPAYALGFALLWAAGRLRPPLPGPAERARGWAQIALVLLAAASLLRQLFHGSLLVDAPVWQGEDIARSVLAVAVAVGLLGYGIRARQRDWRIASLVVMLGAVGKVFLLDAAGLDGLARIASFAALGFSLIGIGWLYSRYLPDERGAAANPVSTPST